MPLCKKQRCPTFLRSPGRSTRQQAFARRDCVQNLAHQSAQCAFFFSGRLGHMVLVNIERQRTKVNQLQKYVISIEF